MVKTKVCSQNWKSLKKQLNLELPKSKVLPSKANQQKIVKLKSNLFFKKKKNNINKSGNTDLLKKPTGTVANAENKKVTENAPVADAEEQTVLSISEIWFDGVSMHDIIAAKGKKNAANISYIKSNIQIDEQELVKSNATSAITRTVGLAVSLVEVGEIKERFVARISIVNQFGRCLLDKYIKPKEPVTDYRTNFSGIEESDFKNAEKFEAVQKEVYEMVKGRIVVGYDLQSTFKYLFLRHPYQDTRDVAYHPAWKRQKHKRPPPLPVLCNKLLKVHIRKVLPSSLEDAQAAMKLFISFKRYWNRKTSKTRLTKKSSKS